MGVAHSGLRAPAITIMMMLMTMTMIMIMIMTMTMTMNDNNIDNDNAIPLGWYLSDARFGFFYTSRGCCTFQRTTTRTISFHWLLCRRPD